MPFRYKKDSYEIMREVKSIESRIKVLTPLSGAKILAIKTHNYLLLYYRYYTKYLNVKYVRIDKMFLL